MVSYALPSLHSSSLTGLTYIAIIAELRAQGAAAAPFCQVRRPHAIEFCVQIGTFFVLVPRRRLAEKPSLFSEDAQSLQVAS